jgi:glycosyltransferase involved in cell wall biosynthesis
VIDSNGGMDNLPTVIMEAMATGLPVVSTNIGGIPEMIIDNETGFLVPPKSSSELSRAILLLLNDPEMAENMGKVGVLHIRQRFSIDRALHETEELYTSLLQNARQPSLREEWT